MDNLHIHDNNKYIHIHVCSSYTISNICFFLVFFIFDLFFSYLSLSFKSENTVIYTADIMIFIFHLHLFKYNYTFVYFFKYIKVWYLDTLAIFWSFRFLLEVRCIHYSMIFSRYSGFFQKRNWLPLEYCWKWH